MLQKYLKLSFFIPNDEKRYQTEELPLKRFNIPTAVSQFDSKNSTLFFSVIHFIFELWYSRASLNVRLSSQSSFGEYCILYWILNKSHCWNGPLLLHSWSIASIQWQVFFSHCFVIYYQTARSNLINSILAAFIWSLGLWNFSKLLRDNARRAFISFGKVGERNYLLHF